MRRLIRFSAFGALLAVLLVPAALGGRTSLAQRLAAALHSKKVHSATTGAVRVEPRLVTDHPSLDVSDAVARDLVGE